VWAFIPRPALYTRRFSFSVQRNIGFGTVVDVGYVGSVGRHLYWRRNLNAIPFGANFLPRNADPSAPATPLPQAFPRPSIGYNNISFAEPAGDSNFEFGLSWTWSKAMDYNDTDDGGVSTLMPARVWNYGLAAFDRTHVLKLNWLWDLPKLSVSNPVVRMAANGWQLSGILSLSSGQPLGVGYGPAQERAHLQPLLQPGCVPASGQRDHRQLGQDHPPRRPHHAACAAALLLTCTLGS